MKVARQKSNGAFVYRSEPPFLKNAVALCGGEPDEYQEVDMTQAEYDANPIIAAQRDAAENEAKIQAEMRRAAVQTLINAGELPGVPADYIKPKENP
jgi:hypothetical protein